MDKKIFTNYMYNLTFQMLNIILPFITTPYVARVLGATGVGQYNYVYGIVSYFGIFAVTGTATYAQREIAKQHSSIELRSKIFWEILAFRLISIVLVSIIYVIYIFNYLVEYRLLFIINFFTIFSWALDVSWYFQGIEDFKVTAVRNSLVRIFSTIFIFILVKSKHDVWIYTLVLTSGIFFGNLTMIPYLKREIVKCSITIIDIFKNTKGIMALFLPVIAIQLYTVLNKVMLGAMTSAKEVGYYSQANQIINIGTTVIYAFVAVLTPRIAFFYSEGKFSKIKSYMSTSIRNVYFLGLPMTFGCIAIANSFVPIFFGNGYNPVIYLMKIMSVLFIIMGLDQLVGTFLVSMDKQNIFTIAVSVAALVNVILNFCFIKLGYGAKGVAYATVISEMCTTIIEIIGLRKYINIRDLLYFFWKYLVPSFVMLVTILIVNYFLYASILGLMLEILIAIIVYSLCLIIIKDPAIFMIINGLLNRKSEN
ncbi:flippase [Limosilactobacillus reuteri]|uniref:flippase n=1 Tax=Limosilactobacillus reuteri TaxID=1598 RepID=UPI003CFCC01A